MKKYLLLLIFWFCGQLYVFPQKKPIDSLRNLLQNNSQLPDSVRIAIQFELTYHLLNSSTDSSQIQLKNLLSEIKTSKQELARRVEIEYYKRVRNTLIIVSIALLLLFWLGITLYNEKRKKYNRLKAQNEEIINHTQRLLMLQEEISLQNENLKKAHDKERKAYQDISYLAEIGKQITASLELETVLETIYTNVNILMDASVFGIGIYKAEQNTIEYRLAIEKGVRYKPYIRDMQNKNQLPVWCIENKKEVFINDFRNEYAAYIELFDDMSIDLEDGQQSAIPVSIIYIPLLRNEMVLGIITVQTFYKNAYEKYHLNYLQSIANYASIALENSIAYHQIELQQKKIAEKNEELRQVNDELHQRQEDLITLYANLEVEKEKVEKLYTQLKQTSEELHKSIQYASHIQKVVMPEKEELIAFFSDIFILHKPKDVVSGDFYWFLPITKERAVFVIADCTGHGVPAAFMSMLGSTILHHILTQKEFFDNPALILKALHLNIQKILKQEENKNDDGMDIAICCFEKKEEIKKIKFSFAGAKSVLFFIENEQLMEVFGDNQHIGGKALKKDFTNQEYELDFSTLFYAFTDGFVDQHNDNRKKFGSTHFKELISEIHCLPFENQKDTLLQTLQTHQEHSAQRDDILVVGLRFC